MSRQVQMLIFVLLTLLTAWPVQADSVVTRWNDAAIQAIRRTKPGTPVVARTLAIVNTCMFDAWAAYDNKAVGTRLCSRLRRPHAERTEDNKNKAISYAAYRALTDLFKEREEMEVFNGLMDTLHCNPDDTSTDTATPSGIGNVAAQAVLDFRHHDGANQLGDYWGSTGAPYSDYTAYRTANTPQHVADPDHWQPLRVLNKWGGYDSQKFVCPQWAKVTPFALTRCDQFRPEMHPATLSSPRYRAQAEQILDLSAHLTDRQKMIAEYWLLGPYSEQPPGHWFLFAESVSRRHHFGIDDDVKLFFALGNALFDAGIASWDCKIAYNSVRPITAIHVLFHGQKVTAWGGPGLGTREITGDDWQPYQPLTVVTPSFPEFCSGHSTFSAAAAEVLKDYTRSDTFGDSILIKAGSSRVEPGLVPAQDLTLSWPTFTAAADEAGLSRRYGGIHFEDGDLCGRKLGRQVGTLAWQKAEMYFAGTAVLHPAATRNTFTRSTSPLMK